MSLLDQSLGVNNIDNDYSRINYHCVVPCIRRTLKLVLVNSIEINRYDFEWEIPGDKIKPQVGCLICYVLVPNIIYINNL